MREKKGCDGLADRRGFAPVDVGAGIRALGSASHAPSLGVNPTFIHFLCCTFLDEIYLSSRYYRHYMCFISLSPDRGLFRRGDMHFGLRAVEAHTTVIIDETGGGRGVSTL